METKKDWNALFDAYDKQTVIKAKIIEFTGKGFQVEVFGVSAFLPGSQLGYRPSDESYNMVGQTIDVVVLKINPFENNIVVSAKSIVEEAKKISQKSAYDEVEIGSIVKGTVKNVTSYGVFVSLGDIDGLIHIKELSYKRINNAIEMYPKGMALDVMVISKDMRSNGPRIGLSLKALERSPWENVPVDYIPGKSIIGTIRAIQDYGVFLEIEPGIQGLLHRTEIPSSLQKDGIKNHFEKQQVLQVIIKEIDVENKKLTFMFGQNK